MTDVAEYINEMKRLHENAVKVQEILNNVIYIDVSLASSCSFFTDTGSLIFDNEDVDFLFRFQLTFMRLEDWF